jgi:uncharacterized protein YecE (DUF72 family)
MPARIHLGCCGWSYLNEGEFPELGNLNREHSKLHAYAKLFDTVEINSTFYRLPRLSTAEKWRNEVDELNPEFEFTVKAFKGITHLHRFQKEESLNSYRSLKEICSALRTRFVLFQSPASFMPSRENINTMLEFFRKINREGIAAVWEPRGKWYDDIKLIERVCCDCKLVHCVDPFRNDPLTSGPTKTAYLRLHGFGKPSMYRYDFSNEELRSLLKKVESLPAEMKDVYVFFNNDSCYHDALAFMKLIG